MDLEHHIQANPNFRTADPIRYVRVKGEIHVSNTLDPKVGHKKIVEEDIITSQVTGWGNRARADAGFLRVDETTVIVSSGSSDLGIPLGFGEEDYEADLSPNGPKGITVSVLGEIFPGKDIVFNP